MVSILDTRTPVTILTGFLGAGKTTLLNELIRQYPEKKFAIIENEFGEINIDSHLVVGVEEGIFELSNGCVCCSLNGELHETLIKIQSQFPHVNHLLVETTGIADPGAVAYSFIANDKVQSVYRIDAIITLVDAKNCIDQLNIHQEARKQVALADVMVFNKTDLIDKEMVDVIISELSKINPSAKIIFTEYGKINYLDILNIGAFSSNSILNHNYGILPNAITKKSLLGNKGRIKVALKHSNISSHSVVIEKAIDIIKFDAWMNLMLNFAATNFYRIKGIVNVHDFEQKLIFQAVNNQYVTERGGHWKDEQRLTKMVFIGKNIDKEMLVSSLNECCYDGEAIRPEIFYKSIMNFQERLHKENKNELRDSTIDSN
ncbi:MAG: GTP-binding protein [Cytophagales bacterium]|nr:MAG: GTP-binding protein [Cytophagales bacterium]